VPAASANLRAGVRLTARAKARSTTIFERPAVLLVKSEHVTKTSLLTARTFQSDAGKSGRRGPRAFAITFRPDGVPMDLLHEEVLMSEFTRRDETDRNEKWTTIRRTGRTTCCSYGRPRRVRAWTKRRRAAPFHRNDGSSANSEPTNGTSWFAHKVPASGRDGLAAVEMRYVKPCLNRSFTNEPAGFRRTLLFCGRPCVEAGGH
jgi:hypothetical protein